MNLTWKTLLFLAVVLPHAALAWKPIAHAAHKRTQVKPIAGHAAHKRTHLAAVRRRSSLISCKDPADDERDDEKRLLPKGPGDILASLPWWFPIALGWILAPDIFGLGGQTPPSLPDDIFSGSEGLTAREERQLLREEASMFSEETVKDLYGKLR